jgi:hypothetical protein
MILQKDEKANPSNLLGFVIYRKLYLVGLFDEGVFGIGQGIV